ncbi:MAG TPA: hypothetical protein VGY57_16190, partial [Vicinamibacterales bacterium]|nr:hypothetical protein [Vicinamibacterales bacterium]
LATFTFAGTGVSWIGAPGPSRGIARIYVDGVYQSDVDCYAAVDQMRTVMFTAANLADGAHTIGVQVSGTQNPAATGASIVVDAFDVVLSTSVPFVTRTQQTDPSVAFSGTWTAGSRFQFWSGEYASYSSTAGAQATFTFTGQNVRWLGDRQFAGGIAHVYIDGVYVTDVDTHAPLQEEYQAALFVATNLPAGTHVLTIQVTGTANPASSGTIVVVDAFDVY